MIPPKKELPNQRSSFTMIGINLLVAVAYILICRMIKNGWEIDVVLLGLHFLGCIIYAIISKKWAWLLAAFVVLMVGFSTCVALMYSQ